MLLEREVRQMLALADVKYASIRHLDEGFSSDLKFVVSSGAGDLLLRVSPILEETQRRFEFDCIGRLHRKGIRCPEPVAFDTLSDWCFGLYTFFRGVCSLDVITGFGVEEQWAFGIAAGEQLRLMHESLEAPLSIDDFAVRGDKYRSHTADFETLGIRLPGQDAADAYVKRNLQLLKDRPTTFRHGDFHLGNLIADGPRLAGVIDFNRCDWGDPYDDFYKTAYFGASYSADYACAVVSAYFGGTPPDDFWPIFNVYVAAVLPADIVWTSKLYPGNLSGCLARCNWVIQNHDFQRGGAPSWWLSCCYTGV